MNERIERIKVELMKLPQAMLQGMAMAVPLNRFPRAGDLGRIPFSAWWPEDVATFLAEYLAETYPDFMREREARPFYPSSRDTDG